MDIRCVVCGEPWDAYGVRHGDMLPWEADLFRKGAGCPCCEGESNGYTPKRLSDVENGDEDPMLRINAREDYEEGKAPKWKRPDDPIIWSCDGCDVQVIRNVDTDELEYRAPYGSVASYRRCWSRYEAPEKPEHTFVGDVHVCEDCYVTCDHCNEPIAPEEGYYTHEKDFCSDVCLSTWEQEEAQSVWEGMSTKERIRYIQRHRQNFKFHSFSDMLGCVRGNHFNGYASELIS